MFRVHCAVLNEQPDQFWLTCSQSYGGHGERETPGHIPNPEAKPLSADGTALETGWESRTPPDNHSRRGPSIRAGAPSPCPDTVIATFRTESPPPEPHTRRGVHTSAPWGPSERAPPTGFRYRKLVRPRGPAGCRRPPVRPPSG